MCTDEINNHMLLVILLTSVSYKITFPVLRVLANFTFHSMYSDFETNNIVFLENQAKIFNFAQTLSPFSCSKDGGSTNITIITS